ncbi:hypothetical protein HK102_011198, partial [Quaeritorhiza haematococci]
GMATAETSRLINDERVSLFIGDVNPDLTTAEAPLLDESRLLHCSPSDMKLEFLDTVSLDFNSIATVAGLAQFGQAGRALLNLFRPESRVVVMREEDPEGECSVRLG